MTIAAFSLLGVPLALAAADWVALARRWRLAHFILKPAVMLAILAWLGFASGFPGGLLWFALGIIFSLLGDILLMLPAELFLAGLIAFLLAHLSYVIGLNPARFPVFNLASLILAGFVALPAVEVHRQLAASAHHSSQGRLALPLLIYIIVIGLMAWSALLSLLRDDWQTIPALAVSTGALLFLLSDTLLAWQKFIAPIQDGQVKNMAAYHLGQILIVFAAALHYLG